jgi:hypothetical protein
VLAAGISGWMKLVAPENVLGAFAVSQFTLLLLLIPRFWQRGIVVSYWQQRMMVPVVAVQPVEPAPVPAVIVPESSPVIPENT